MLKFLAPSFTQKAVIGNKQFRFICFISRLESYKYCSVKGLNIHHSGSLPLACGEWRRPDLPGLMEGDLDRAMEVVLTYTNAKQKL
jgi:hypothetical protein